MAPNIHLFSYELKLLQLLDNTAFFYIVTVIVLHFEYFESMTHSLN